MGWLLLFLLAALLPGSRSKENLEFRTLKSTPVEKIIKTQIRTTNPNHETKIDTPEINLGKQIIFKNESSAFYAVSNVRTSETEI